tara:strand:+ start:963 stop:1430 length:468 start_codon:yes stop_codon:yes gene_type:complete
MSIFLGGTGSANELHDYEEGTFTPQLRTASDTTEASYTQRAGIYTKVGNTVTWQVRMDMNGAPASGSGAIQVHNLPFAGQDWAGFDWPGFCEMGYYLGLQNMGSTTNPRMLGPFDNNTFVRFHAFTQSGDASVNGVNQLSNSMIMIMGGTYQAST